MDFSLRRVHIANSKHLMQILKSVSFTTFHLSCVEGERVFPLFWQASDVYSLSIVMWHLLSRGNAFFQEENPARLYIRVAEQDERPPFPDDCNRDLKLLIEACWAPSPGDRPSITAVLLNLVQIYRSCPKV